MKFRPRNGLLRSGPDPIDEPAQAIGIRQTFTLDEDEAAGYTLLRIGRSEEHRHADRDNLLRRRKLAEERRFLRLNCGDRIAAGQEGRCHLARETLRPDAVAACDQRQVASMKDVVCENNAFGSDIYEIKNFHQENRVEENKVWPTFIDKPAGTPRLALVWKLTDTFVEGLVVDRLLAAAPPDQSKSPMFPSVQRRNQVGYDPDTPRQVNNVAAYNASGRGTIKLRVVPLFELQITAHHDKSDLAALSQQMIEDGVNIAEMVGHIRLRNFARYKRHSRQAVIPCSSSEKLRQIRA